MIKEIIYKYKLEILIGETQEITVQSGAQPISVIEQKGEIQLYCKFFYPEDYEYTEKQKYKVVATGQPFTGSAGLSFVDTVKVDSYVFHIFRVLWEQ